MHSLNLLVALHGLAVMDFKGGYDVAITGMGTIGLLTLQCVRALGAKRIVVFDIDDERLDVAKEYGADICLNTKDEGFKEIVDQATQGRGFEMVIETAGGIYQLCLELATNREM